MTQHTPPEPIPIVFGSFPVYDAFRQGLGALRSAGYSEAEVGVLCLADQHSHEMQSLQWLSSIGAFTMPGVGAVIAAGPLMSAMIKAGDLGAFGGDEGFTAAMIALGMHVDDAEAITEQLRHGALLLTAYPDALRGREPRRLLTNAGAPAVYSSKHIHHNGAAA